MPKGSKISFIEPAMRIRCIELWVKHLEKIVRN